MGDYEGIRGFFSFTPSYNGDIDLATLNTKSTGQVYNIYAIRDIYIYISCVDLIYTKWLGHKFNQVSLKMLQNWSM